MKQTLQWSWERIRIAYIDTGSEKWISTNEGVATLASGVKNYVSDILNNPDEFFSFFDNDWNELVIRKSDILYVMPKDVKPRHEMLITERKVKVIMLKFFKEISGVISIWNAKFIQKALEKDKFLKIFTATKWDMEQLIFLNKAYIGRVLSM